MSFDLAIRNADVASASDRGGLGARDGRIVAIGNGMAAGVREIDAAGRLVTHVSGREAVAGTDAPFTKAPIGTPLDRALRNADPHHGVDCTPFEGQPIKAWPRLKICHGREVWREGQYLGEAGWGRFLPCDRPAPAAVRWRGHQGPLWSA